MKCSQYAKGTRCDLCKPEVQDSIPVKLVKCLHKHHNRNPALGGFHLVTQYISYDSCLVYLGSIAVGWILPVLFLTSAILYPLLVLLLAADIKKRAAT